MMRPSRSGGDPLFRRGRHLVTASLTDGRDNLFRNPALEVFCCRQLAGQDQAVKTGFVDADGFAFVVRTSPLNQGSGFIFAIDMRAAEPEKPQDGDNFIYGVTAAKNAQPTPFKVQAGRAEELFREAQALAESDEDD